VGAREEVLASRGYKPGVGSYAIERPLGGGREGHGVSSNARWWRTTNACTILQVRSAGCSITPFAMLRVRHICSKPNGASDVTAGLTLHPATHPSAPAAVS